MFLLPNGLKIDEEGLISGLNDSVVSHKYYFDILMGQVGRVNSKGKNLRGKQIDGKRYFELPKISKSAKEVWAKELIWNMVWRENPLLADALNKALNGKDGGFDAFYKVLKQSDFIYGWPDWESHYLYEELISWFDTLPMEIKEEFEFDDDCSLCQLMKKGEHSIADFKMAAGKMSNKMIGFSNNGKQDKHLLYYEAMDILGSDRKGTKKALELLLEALNLDPDFVQTYIGFVYVYEVLDKDEEVREYVRQAFEKTQKKFSKWPKSMSWGDLDNRAYMRAIQFMAEDLEDTGDKDGAVELYRLLLKMNPNDNQGVRYVLAGLYAGLTGKEVNKMFDEGNKKQDWGKLEKLVEVQNKKHLFWKKPKWA
ncbi:MAG: hypothetical protein M1127_00275 [Patescibacteria group bacterium]|nr:hypothetical protein [Patescibacteria group bacterium]